MFKFYALLFLFMIIKQQQAGSVQFESDEVKPYQTNCSQPGRLPLLSDQKYWVSIGEIQFGLAQQECMNASILGSKWRNTKNMDSGQLLCEQSFVCVC
ncbi:hypothetical protein niasHS_009772 [Heterodera schachtii]|uniref:Transcription factor AP-2 C-terminal domain-containing protein n=1 Tax=Heterodera schachtii TaxID=97005 RepID=A0ABD2IWJ2_HETSC